MFASLMTRAHLAVSDFMNAPIHRAGTGKLTPATLDPLADEWKIDGAVTMALDYGRVHPSLSSSETFTIYTPSVVATPVAISGAPFSPGVPGL